MTSDAAEFPSVWRASTVPVDEELWHGRIDRLVEQGKVEQEPLCDHNHRHRWQAHMCAQKRAARRNGWLD